MLLQSPAMNVYEQPTAVRCWGPCVCTARVVITMVLAVIGKCAKIASNKLVLCVSSLCSLCLIDILKSFHGCIAFFHFLVCGAV